MTDFKKSGRIRNAMTALRDKFRQTRTTPLNVEPHALPSTPSFIRRYRTPIFITCAAVVAVAGIYVGASQYVQARTNTFYQVLVQGEPVGEISKQELVDELIAGKAAELAQAETSVRYKLDDDQVTYQVEKAYNRKPDDAATLSKLSAQLKTHAVGVKLIVDGKAIAVVKDQETAETLLRRVKNKFAPMPYTPKKGEASVKALSLTKTAAVGTSQRTVHSVSFAEEVKTEEVTVNPEQIKDPETLYKSIVNGDTTKRLYTVKKGDCIGCIAHAQNVSADIIYKNNPWIDDDEIKIGDVLDLTKQQPLLTVNSDEQVTEVEVIDPPIEIRKSDELKAGKSKVVRQGTNGKRLVTYHLIKTNGAVLEEEQISSVVLTPAISTVILKGTKVTPSEGTGTLSWPVKGHRITSYQGSRWGRTHKGIDIVGNKNILAADNGVVTTSGTGISGLGNSVTIDHQNGFKTVYGHMSKLLVKKGQVVQKGDVIGIMGNTGHSFGTHLHFEVYLNGKLKNPTSYL
ncbi:M23 family metallopeptidase [Cohnella nanjingensis]|uniref:M23 family metallopeptidase n=1 Tax=Cohnella nanjingensis TaxID=1387779 RepID=A0A7X0VHP3_9BACL|nr:M23 family metallopeptidase [Cohnella nanjingensis]MBB6674362.1 M23 family metallopeptidase [Cohnella nanjingensis]